MKNDISTIGIPNLWQQLRHAGHRVVSFSVMCAFTLYNAMAGFVTNLQVGRMESVLRRMSDKELTQIGITRSEIKRHARFLVVYEYDGL
jgi:uncharacterized protein YjiS (DUF1127 family)